MIILSKDLNREVNKKIDRIISELIGYCEKEFVKTNYEVDNIYYDTNKIYGIIENIKLWEVIRSHENINIDLEYRLNKVVFRVLDEGDRI